MYDPLLDTNVRVRTWYDIAEELQDKVAWVARKGRSGEAFKWLNVLDLIDSEASAYWREYGMRIYAGEQVEVPKARQPSAVQEAHGDAVVRAPGADPDLLLD